MSGIARERRIQEIVEFGGIKLDPSIVIEALKLLEEKGKVKSEEVE